MSNYSSFLSSKLRGRQGFTIVELLIVIVVIGILAAITIVSYNGIQQRAVEVAIASDLRSGGNSVEIESAGSGNYPPSGYEPKSGPNATITYTYYAATNTYCLQATSTRNTSLVYRLQGDGGMVEKAACPASLNMPAPTNLYFGQNAQNAYVEWVWPSAVTTGNYTVRLSVTCVATSATLTTREQTNVAADPGQSGPVMSVNRSALSSCTGTWRFTIVYVSPATNTQSPSASVTS